MLKPIAINEVDPSSLAARVDVVNPLVATGFAHAKELPRITAADRSFKERLMIFFLSYYQNSCKTHC
jgi:hypothetical protein